MLKGQLPHCALQLPDCAVQIQAAQAAKLAAEEGLDKARAR